MTHFNKKCYFLSCQAYFCLLSMFYLLFPYTHLCIYLISSCNKNYRKKKSNCKASINSRKGLKLAILERKAKQNTPIKCLKGCKQKAAPLVIKRKNVHSANHRLIIILKQSWLTAGECIYINTTALQEVFWLQTWGCGNPLAVEWLSASEKHGSNFWNSTYSICYFFTHLLGKEETPACSSWDILRCLHPSVVIPWWHPLQKKVVKGEPGFSGFGSSPQL